MLSSHGPGNARKADTLVRNAFALMHTPAANGLPGVRSALLEERRRGPSSSPSLASSRPQGRKQAYRHTVELPNDAYAVE
ncbi:hypothetical protein J1614_011423 [Plenodomus biglobosus]|nr:hypothetical protein J1614_011423 [Plenodomus biglobosus]